jgi:hypothetical protein
MMVLPQPARRLQRIGYRFDLESKSSGTDGVLELPFKNFLGWKNSQVLRNVYAGSVELEEFDLPRAGTGAKDNSKWFAFSVFAFVSGEPTKVEFHLPLVLWPEASLLQFFCGAASYVAFSNAGSHIHSVSVFERHITRLQA